MGVDNSSTSGDLDVVVDQSTETIDPENPHIGCWSGWRDGSLRRCLAECPVGPMLVVGRHLAQQRDRQLSSTQEQHPVQQRTTDRGDPPLGEGVRWRCPHWRPPEPDAWEARIAAQVLVKVASRSRTRNLNCSMRSARSMRRVRACWATGSPVGLAVTPRRWTRRVETSSTNRTSRRLRKTVSSGRGRRPRSLGLGGQELLPGQAGAAWCRVDAASVEEQPHRARCELCPSRASSPWRRRELHVGFSAAIGRIRRRSSGTVEGRPGWWCGEVQRRLIRSRCQPSTISGVTNRWRRCCVGSRRVNAARRPGLASRSVVG